MSRWSRLVVLTVLVTTVGLAPPTSAATPNPALDVQVVEEGLDIPWDIAFLPAVGSTLPAGSMLYTERARKRLTLRLPSGEKRTIFENPTGMWAAGETGLMAVEIDRDFATNREFVTCHGYKSGSTQDVRVVRWRMDPTFTSATAVRNLVTGLPSTSGRHGGCSLVKGGEVILYVGTGDAATGTNAQNRGSGGGKVLRIDIRTGAPINNNTWISSSKLITRQLATYGHRNVQGLARRSDGTIWSSEHGSYRDDEVNRISRGKNYGWNPVPRRSGDPSYNEGANSPMTDYAIPGAQEPARWDSGDPTVATGGIDFVYGSKWAGVNGALASPSLKGQALRFLKFDAAGKYQPGAYKPPVLDHTFGRLRAAVFGPDGSLYLTTSNGGNDKILKVTPK